MAKAMLIMDMPKSCAKCDISSKVKSKVYVRCPVLKRVVCKFENFIPNDCPLRKCPKEKDENATLDEIEYYEARGFNSCIDEILGGGE